LRRYDKCTSTYLLSSYCCFQCIDFLFLSFSFHFSLDPRRQQLAPKREHVQFWDRHNDHASVSSVLSQAHTHAHAHAHAHTHAHAHPHTHTHTRAHAHTRTHTRTHTHAHTHAHTRTDAHTHTRT